MSAGLFALLTAIGLYQCLELYYLFRELRLRPSYSPIYRILTHHRNSTWIRRLTIGYDLPRVGIHCCLLIVLACLLVWFTSKSWVIWLGLQVVFLQATLAILLLDQLSWVRSSVLLYFQALRGRLYYLVARRNTDKQHAAKWNVEINQLRFQVQDFTIGKYIPRFISRFFVVLLVTILTFSVTYYAIEWIYPGSFMVPSSTSVNYQDLLFNSVFLTTSFDALVVPQTAVARFFSSLQGLVNLYLLALVISFFGSVSENEINAERNKLIDSIDRGIVPENRPST